MNRNAKMRRKPVGAGGHLGPDPGSNRRNARHGVSLLHRLIVRGGRAFFGVLPGFRHVRAANDPEA
jgi:hypothetical protein